MDMSNSPLLVKRAVSVKAIVTPRWKEEAQQQLQIQIDQIDSQLQQIELQGQQMIAEIEKKNLKPLGPQAQQQVESISAQINQEKNKRLEQKNQILQQLQQVQLLELDQEVSQGQIDSFFNLQKGDNLIQKMQVEILLRDGEVIEIRGEV
ncbi:MAG: YlqD family protein [Geitlerinemataceae cyanobacterium]